MKRTNRNKIVISTLLATVLIGAGAVKINDDSIQTAAYLQDVSTRAVAPAVNVYDDGNYAQSALKGAPERLVQEIPETNGNSQAWWEYKTSGYENTDSIDDQVVNVGKGIYVALNYHLVDLGEETTTIGGYETNKYYSLGIVFENEKHQDINGNTIWNDDGTKNANYLDKIYNGVRYDWDPTDPLAEYYYSDGIIYGLEHGVFESGTNDKNELNFLHENPDGVTKADVVASGFDDYKNPYDPDENFLIRIQAENGIQSNISEEDWHEQFDNDERTLFGAEHYHPGSHVIFKIPVKDNPEDNNLDDSFGITPSTTTGIGLIAGDAVSDKDVLALSRINFKIGTSTSHAQGESMFAMKFGSTNENVYKGDWDTTIDNAMLLTYPKPRFEITPKGYNDRNEYEVEVLFDHMAIPTDYDIINEISYVMMGPESKDSAKQVLWDEITITDTTVTRNKRTSADDPTMVETSWSFDDPNLPEGYKIWTDGDTSNGGDVPSVSGDPAEVGEQTIFETNGSAEDGTTTTYVGDMELAGDSVIKSTITYDDLYYAQSEEDLSKEYTFYNTIQIAPTALGYENKYLTDIPYGKYSDIKYDPTVLKIIPDNAAPTIEHFEVIKPTDIEYVDPAETLTVSFSGDTKSEAEDIGVGLKRTFINGAQIIGHELDNDGNMVGEEILLSDPTPLNGAAIDASDNGAFSGEIETKSGLFKANTDYRISLRTFYGDEVAPSDLLESTHTMDYMLEGEYSDIHVHGKGYRTVVISNNAVSYDLANPELGATVTFDYAQVLPAGADGTIDEYDLNKLEAVSIVNNAGTIDEEIVYSIEDLSGFDYATDQTGLEIIIPADKLKENKEYSLTTRVITKSNGSVDSEVASTFQTAPIGPFTPEISSFVRENETDVTGGVTSDFKFSLKQQYGNGLNVSPYSESAISKITFELGETTDGVITNELTNINSTDNPDRIAIPTDDESEILVTGNTTADEQIIFDTTKTYGYKITVDYAGDTPVVKEGAINFELKGLSELETEDVAITSLSSTLTTVSFDVEINDVEIAAGYDSYTVKSLELLDGEGQKVESNITWKDVDGTVITSPIDSPEGESFTGKASVFIKNIKSGTDFSGYKLKIVTDSENMLADGTEENPTFKTEYIIDVMDLITGTDLIDVDGNFANSIDKDREFMDLTPIQYSEIAYADPTMDSATFWITFEDELDVLTPNGIVLTDSNGETYSADNGNLIITPELNDSTKEAGQKVYKFEIKNLSDDTTFEGFTMSYIVSEEIEYEGTTFTSTTNQETELTDLSFTTLPKPDESHFPWWIIILLLLTLIGILILLVLLFLRSVRVVSTTETTKGSTTFVVNRDKQSGFLDTINGAKLEATQNGNTSNVEFKASVNADNKVAITLTGITNDAPIKGLKFIVDNSAVEASNAKVEAANKSLEDKFAKENEAYQAAVKTWEENKAKATEAGKEFTEAKPAAPAKPTLEKLAKPNKDVKVIGSVKTALEDSSNKEEPKKPATEEKTAAKKTTTAAQKPAVKKPTEPKTEEENKSAKGSAEIIY